MVRVGEVRRSKGHAMAAAWRPKVPPPATAGKMDALA